MFLFYSFSVLSHAQASHNKTRKLQVKFSFLSNSNFCCFNNLHLNSFYKVFLVFQVRIKTNLPSLRSKSYFTTIQLFTSFPYTNHNESLQLSGMFLYKIYLSFFNRFWDTNRDESPISLVTSYIIDAFISLSFVFRSKFR